MKLSKRLSVVASFVKEGSSIADIGTDHGYVPIALAERKMIAHGLAMEVREGPLKRAREHIRRHGLEGTLETRLSDGVKELRAGEADTVIIAGMGGGLVIHILEDGKRLWEQVERWILSPQSELARVREYLAGNGFLIEREEMLEEEGKYYTVMEVVRGEMGDLTPWEALYGPRLIQTGSPVLREFLEREKGILGRIREELLGQEGEGARRRGCELEERLGWIERAEQRMRR